MELEEILPFGNAPSGVAIALPNWPLPSSINLAYLKINESPTNTNTTIRTPIKSRNSDSRWLCFTTSNVSI